MVATSTSIATTIAPGARRAGAHAFAEARRPLPLIGAGSRSTAFSVMASTYATEVAAVSRPLIFVLSTISEPTTETGHRGAAGADFRPQMRLRGLHGPKRGCVGRLQFRLHQVGL